MSDVRRNWGRRALIGSGSKWLPVIDDGLCIGCSVCVEACGSRSLDILDGVAVLARPHTCCSEEHCMEACSVACIQMDWRPLTGNRSVGQWTEEMEHSINQSEGP